MEDIILLEVKSDIAYITLNRPQQKNALNSEMLTSLNEAINKVNANEEIKVCIIRSGCDGIFSAGADIKERKGMDETQLKKRRILAQEVYKNIDNTEKITIAVVNGKNFGGGIEIVASCDFIISSNKAEFCLPEVKWGSLGATQRISRLISKGLAKYYLLTAESINAEEAYRIGLTSVLVPETEIIKKTREIAMKIAGYPMQSVRLTKKCIDIAHETTMSEGIKFEVQAIETIISQNEWKKGVDRFANNKKG